MYALYDNDDHWNEQKIPVRIKFWAIASMFAFRIYIISFFC